MRSRTLGPASGLLLTAIVVYALNLRGPIVAVAPVVEELAASLGISVATAGVLSSIPVILFAVAAPVAGVLMRRLTLETTVLLSLAVVAGGTAIRSLGGFGWAVAGTVVLGAAIAVGNVVVPVLVRRDFRGREGTVNGIYTAALNLGSVVTTALTAPLAQVLGWRWALVAWSVLTLAAGLLWWRVRAATAAGRGEHPAPEAETAPPGVERDGLSESVWRRWDVWLLVVALGGQSFSYYGVSAWLPTLLGDTVGLDANAAGVASATFQAMALVGALGTPALIARGVPVRRMLLVLAGLWVALPLGLMLAPGANVVWMASAGVAQGGNFTVILTIMLRRSRSGHESRRVSAFVQGLGYGIAATGPTALGLVHAATGGWTAPLVVVLAVLTVMAVAGLVVASARPLPSRAG